MSLSGYLLRQIERAAETPTLEEMLQRIRKRTPLREPVDIAAIIREERDRR